MKILIVEDETLLALELESELEAAGHTVIGQAMSSTEARELADEKRPDFAFVDIHLIDGVTGIEVGRHLKENGIPYVFVSGNVRRIPEDFAGAIGAIEKPYTMNGLQNAVNFVERFVKRVADVRDAPPSLILAPWLKDEARAEANERYAAGSNSRTARSGR